MFLPKVLEQTAEAESPRDFFRWSALAAIAAVLKRNVYIDRYYFKVYPNIYVILVAKSGLRKGAPPAMAAKLVNAVNNTRVIEGRSSIQALIQDLANAWVPEGQNKPMTDACGFLVSPELAAAMIEDPQAMTIMTDLYDSQYHEKWKNRLKGSGLETLEHPTITWLAASNMELLKTIVTQKEIYGGFLGRTIMVTADKKNRINSLVNRPDKYIDYDDLTADLREISKLSGPCTLTELAKKHFDLWYNKVASTQSEDTTGTYERLDSHVLKLSMLLAAGNKCSLEIDEDIIEEAIELCAPMVKSASKTTQGQGKNPLADVAMKFFQDLVVKGEASRQETLRKYWGDLTANDLDTIVDTFSQAGAIKTVNRDMKVYYRLTDETREAMKKDEH